MFKMEYEGFHPMYFSKVRDSKSIKISGHFSKKQQSLYFQTF